jgi:hypothetical protein
LRDIVQANIKKLRDDLNEKIDEYKKLEEINKDRKDSPLLLNKRYEI